MDNVSTVCESIDEELDYNNVSIDFLSSLDSIPNKRGFKMAFLNIVSLITKYDIQCPTNLLISLLIDEPTRITMSTSSLIDHIVSNTPEKISDSGVIHTGISDHSLVFAIRKISVIKKQEHTVEIRNMKNFNEEKFIAELSKQEWEYVYFFADDPNAMWEIWKRIFLEVLDKHAPLQQSSVQKKSLGLQTILRNLSFKGTS